MEPRACVYTKNSWMSSCFFGLMPLRLAHQHEHTMYASINIKTGDIELAVWNIHTDEEEIVYAATMHDISDREDVEMVLDCKASDLGYHCTEFYWY